MCGIVGFIGNGKQDYLDRMVSQLTHRGPDSKGIFMDTDMDVYLGHRRLEVIDISGGSQPMKVSNNRFVITYNGEIYNAGLIRKELEDCGYQFITDHSDTEVLLHAYNEWGSKFVDRLNGMWAFAIYDKEKGIMFLSRDRFGEKPLFYTLQNNIFAFSSELKAFRYHPGLSMNLSDIGLQKYCAHGYFPGDHTPYKEAYKLPAGCNLFLSIDRGRLEVKRYWSYKVEPEHGESKTIEKKWSEEIHSLLEKSVQRRLIADVPLGVFLSGGLDSSIVAYFASRHLTSRKLKTFSIGFDDHTFDETKWAQKAADFLGTEHLVTLFKKELLENLLKEVLEKLDEPLSDSSLISQYLLSKQTKKKVTVTLGGDGGDEIFAGYDTFKAANIASLAGKLLPRIIHPAIKKSLGVIPRSHSYMSFRFKLQRLLEGIGHKKSLWQPLWLSPVALEDTRELFSNPLDLEELYSEAITEWEACPSRDIIDKSLEFYGNIFLQNQILTKVDRTSMMHGLEVRSPFLDIDLINCARKIPSYYKIRRGHSKYILKKAMEGNLPGSLIWRKKMGFSAPLGKWFLDGLISLDSKDIWGSRANQLIQKKMKSHYAKREDNRLFLWNIWMLTEFMRLTNDYVVK